MTTKSQYLKKIKSLNEKLQSCIIAINLDPDLTSDDRTRLLSYCKRLERRLEECELICESGKIVEG